MRKHMILGLWVFSFMVFIIAVYATDLSAKSGRAAGGGHPAVSIPEHAIEVVKGKVFWLGTAMEKGRLIEGYAIIHHKKGFGKPAGCNNDDVCQGWEDTSCGDCTNGGGEPDTGSCYDFIGKGVKWKYIEDYIVDTDNSAGLSGAFIRSNLEADIDKWEDAADGSIDDQFLNIIGDEVAGTVDGADMIRTDGKNEILFGDVDSAGAIAVTVVWGIFRGPPQGRELVEWDQVYDDWDFDWSEDCNSYACIDKMDFENIAIHELGHSLGLGDLYDNGCADQTMYGYAAYGETNKRTLENGDINGIYNLYK